MTTVNAGCRCSEAYIIPTIPSILGKYILLMITVASQNTYPVHTMIIIAMACTTAVLLVHVQCNEDRAHVD